MNASSSPPYTVPGSASVASLFGCVVVLVLLVAACSNERLTEFWAPFARPAQNATPARESFRKDK